MYGHHPKYRCKITIFSGLRVIVKAIYQVNAVSLELNHCATGTDMISSLKFLLH
jgi:hypothetical protein